MIVSKPFSNWGYPQLQVHPQLTYVVCECIHDSHVLQMHTNTLILLTIGKQCNGCGGVLIWPPHISVGVSLRCLALTDRWYKQTFKDPQKLWTKADPPPTHPHFLQKVNNGCSALIWPPQTFPLPLLWGTMYLALTDLVDHSRTQKTLTKVKPF